MANATYELSMEDQLHPLKVNESILETYALMRGPLAENRGPLYDTCLYKQFCPSASSDGSGEKVPIPDRPRCPGLYLYEVTPPSVTQSRTPSSQGHRESSSSKEFSSEAPAMYGFLKVNEKWVDPDSEEAIYNAWNELCPGSSHIFSKAPSLRGPHILSPSEQSVVYAEFVKDEDDEEGDPRLNRISPSTFAIWAEGAIKNHRHRHIFVEQPPPTRTSPRQRSTECIERTIFVPQYDKITGEGLSPAYSIDQAPRLLLSPQGVNINRYPCHFAYSYPLDDLNHKRAAFFDANISNTSPAPSGDECFTFEGIRDALTIDDDKESGLLRSRQVQDYINHLHHERLVSSMEARQATLINEALSQQVNQLQREVALMRVEVNDASTRAARQRRHLEQLKGYVEILTHEHTIALSNTQKLHARNDDLREQAGKLVSERHDLQIKIGVIRAAELSHRGDPAAVDRWDQR